MARALTYLGELGILVGLVALVGAGARALGVLAQPAVGAGPLVGIALGAIVVGLSALVLGLHQWSEAEKRAEADL